VEFWSGCERMVTRGTKEFQSGHVDVFVRAAQICVEGAVVVVELPMWRVALVAGMVGVERVVLLGSVSSGILDLGGVDGINWEMNLRLRS